MSSRNKKYILTISGLAVAGLIVGTGAFLFVNKKVQSPFTDTIESQANYALYYPAVLPSGYKIDSTSVKYSQNVVTYGITKDGSPALAVSEQQVPKDLNFDEFYKKNVETPTHSQTPEGKLTTGKMNGLFVCMLVTDSTWIIVNDPSGAHQGDLKKVCENMKLSV